MPRVSVRFRFHQAALQQKSDDLIKLRCGEVMISIFGGLESSGLRGVGLNQIKHLARLAQALHSFDKLNPHRSNERIPIKSSSKGRGIFYKGILMKTTNWSGNDISRFWQLADELQEQTVDHAKGLFSFAESASPKDLMSLLVQYRFFTIYYIPDIAVLIARMQDGKLRSFLADILSDELGYGDPLKAHPRLYDDFLKSIGAADQDLDTLAIKDNLELLDNVRRKLIDPSKSMAYGVGLRGMGGECVCQIYLSRFHEHIVKNPYIQARKSTIDWRFWDLHVGEHDVDHRLRTRQLINDEIVVQGASEVAELGQGYCESMASWGAFWQNVFASVKSQHVNRVRVAHTVNFQMPVDPDQSSTNDVSQFELGALA